MIRSKQAILSPQLMLAFRHAALLLCDLQVFLTDNIPPVFHNIYTENLRVILGLIACVALGKFSLSGDGQESPALG